MFRFSEQSLLVTPLQRAEQRGLGTLAWKACPVLAVGNMLIYSRLLAGRLHPSQERVLVTGPALYRVVTKDCPVTFPSAPLRALQGRNDCYVILQMEGVEGRCHSSEYEDTGSWPLFSFSRSVSLVPKPLMNQSL